MRVCTYSTPQTIRVRILIRVRDEMFFLKHICGVVHVDGMEGMVFLLSYFILLLS